MHKPRKVTNKPINHYLVAMWQFALHKDKTPQENSKIVILQVSVCKNVISSKYDKNTSFIQAVVYENTINLNEMVTNKCTMSCNA